MTDPPPYEDNGVVPTHKLRPSLVTNASALAESTITFGSFISSEEFARLSQFPPPPQEIPFSPIEGSMDMPSPVTSDYSQMSIGTSSTGRRPLPMPPISSIAPLNVQRKPPLPVPPPPVNARLPDVPLPVSPQDPQPSPPGFAPPPPTHPHSILQAFPSPHDWHDGSSSIANDPYGEAALSTSFITSLLSSMSDDGSPAFPPSAFSAKRSKYEPSVISNALTTDSTITYPPPRLFPPPLPSPRAFPPLPSRPVLDDTPDEPVPLTPPPINPLAGRATPETLRSFDSSDTARQSSSIVSHMMGVAPSAQRSMCTTPSLQSLNSSTTPLMHTVVHGEPIMEEEEPKTASGSGESPSRKSRSTRGRRASVAPSTKSAKSYVSSLVARISHSSGDRKSVKQVTASWFRGKALPPVPPLPSVPFREVRKAEDALALPELVSRAQVLSAMLDSGQRPYDSDELANLEPKTRQTVPTDVGYRIGPSADAWNSGANPNLARGARERRARSVDHSYRGGSPGASPVRLRRFAWSGLSKRQRIGCISTFLVLIVAITLAITAGVIAGERKSHAHVCPGSFAGAACNLDASCTCTSSVSGQCKQLAQGLVSLVPVMNAVFGSNYTADDISTAVWESQGISSNDNCASQVLLVDVAPALLLSASPNRTEWAQAALLWDIVRSENLTANAGMRDLIQNANWHSLGSPDGPSSQSGSQFIFHNAGYDFDFAAQTVTAPLVTFLNAGQPSADQIDKVNDVARSALDRMYTFATASSTQQYSALLHYWTGDLQQASSTLSSFVSHVAGSPILLPFDATSAPLVSLINGTSPQPFPPPLSCYPGLSSSQIQSINTLETSVFGLTVAPAAGSFNSACFPNRPVYGVLDILQLRLPFSDSRTGVAKQAAVLISDAYPRTVVYSGEAVSALPGSGSPGPMSNDPRDYGTTRSLDHVILKYLRSLDQETAASLVNFVLNGTALPPGPSSPIFTSISSLPLLEVAVFGSITPADIFSVASSLSNSTGGLFFGTSASATVRNWTIDTVHQEMVWTENATAPEVVHDSSNTNADFNLIWNSAFNFFHSPTNGAIVVESNITTAFQVDGLLTP